MTHDQAVETLAAERYLLDEMSEIERFRFEEHFFECEECAETMRLGHRLRSDAKEVFAAAPARPVSEEATAPTGNRHPWWHPTRVALPWAAAAVLALGLVYQARDPAISGTTEETRVLSPVVLRPASRGQVPDVVLPEQGDVALWLDLTAVAPDEPITYKLTRDDGGLVDSGTARAPASGAPFVLMVPADRLEAGRQFVVTVTTTSDSAAPPAEYRFNAAR